MLLRAPLVNSFQTRSKLSCHCAFFYSSTFLFRMYLIYPTLPTGLRASPLTCTAFLIDAMTRLASSNILSNQLNAMCTCYMGDFTHGITIWESGMNDTDLFTYELSLQLLQLYACCMSAIRSVLSNGKAVRHLVYFVPTKTEH